MIHKFIDWFNSWFSSFGSGEDDLVEWGQFIIIDRD